MSCPHDYSKPIPTTCSCGEIIWSFTPVTVSFVWVVCVEITVSFPTVEYFLSQLWLRWKIVKRSTKLQSSLLFPMLSYGITIWCLPWLLFSRLDRYSKETTVVNQIFGGFLRSQGRELTFLLLLLHYGSVQICERACLGHMLPLKYLIRASAVCIVHL